MTMVNLRTNPMSCLRVWNIKLIITRGFFGEDNYAKFAIRSMASRLSYTVLPRLSLPFDTSYDLQSQSIKTIPVNCHKSSPNKYTSIKTSKVITSLKRMTFNTIRWWTLALFVVPPYVNPILFLVHVFLVGMQSCIYTNSPLLMTRAFMFSRCLPWSVPEYITWIINTASNSPRKRVSVYQL